MACNLPLMISADKRIKNMGQMINRVGRYKDTSLYLPRVKDQLLSMRKMVEDILSLKNQIVQDLQYQIFIRLYGSALSRTEYLQPLIQSFHPIFRKLALKQ